MTGSHIVLINVHGLLRSLNLELGRDADTGGQTLYVLQMAKTLANHSEISHVTLLTRLLAGNNVSKDYEKEYEKLGPRGSIIRIQAGNDIYLNKENIWPVLDEFTINAYNYLNQHEIYPTLIHAHYADSGYVGLELSELLNVKLAFTAHSLGRVKRKQLLTNNVSLKNIEKDRFDKRIDIEERILDQANLIIASSSQEKRVQYSSYNNFASDKIYVIPPGYNKELLYPENQNLNKSHYLPEIKRFLIDSSKPMILAIARPDRRKNLNTIVDVFGTDPILRKIANLVLLMGCRTNLTEMGEGECEVIKEILHKIDDLDLYGHVAIPKKHKPIDVAWLYRECAKTHGVFINVALIEPFGLTYIEAGAMGAPLIATCEGGGVEIINRCDNGLLVTPKDKKQIAEAIKKLIENNDLWEKCSKNGKNYTPRFFSWEKHVDNYLKIIKKNKI